ncbi:MAG TPA: SRPBCC domain-containing protein [Polyangiaceae bacterium]|jgi:uncharacterized protein YndB with AHSA1/START domain|nr:SRPBCC domain-containing protein [Polyangiaceae bacterium]
MTRSLKPSVTEPSLLTVRRIIRAAQERVFQAWTSPEQLKQWWGPRPVRCVGAEIDLRVGGGYRIANQLPDGRVLWIVGEFERIDPPRELVYSFRTEPGQAADSGARELERVTVRFEPRQGATEVIVIHERIASPALREDHEKGWLGCLDGLGLFLDDFSPSA